MRKSWQNEGWGLVTLKSFVSHSFFHIFWVLLISQKLKKVFAHNSSVMRQKGEYRNKGNKKTKDAKFSEKRIFLTPWLFVARSMTPSLPEQSF